MNPQLDAIHLTNQESLPIILTILCVLGLASGILALLMNKLKFLAANWLYQGTLAITSVVAGAGFLGAIAVGGFYYDLRKENHELVEMLQNPQTRILNAVKTPYGIRITIGRPATTEDATILNQKIQVDVIPKSLTISATKLKQLEAANISIQGVALNQKELEREMAQK